MRTTCSKKTTLTGFADSSPILLCCRQSNSEGIKGSRGAVRLRLPSVSQVVGSPGSMWGPGIAPNDDLDPQESIGWDIGIEQPFSVRRFHRRHFLRTGIGTNPVHGMPVNIVLLGALVQSGTLGFTKENVIKAIKSRTKKSFLDKNLEAFELGFKAAENYSA